MLCETSNNKAEALVKLMVLKFIKSMPCKESVIKDDSQIVIVRLKGNHPIQWEFLYIRRYMKAEKSQIELQVKPIKHVQRESNKVVDWLSNKDMLGNQDMDCTWDLSTKELWKILDEVIPILQPKVFKPQDIQQL